MPYTRSWVHTLSRFLRSQSPPAAHSSFARAMPSFTSGQLLVAISPLHMSQGGSDSDEVQLCKPFDQAALSHCSDSRM